MVCLCLIAEHFLVELPPLTLLFKFVVWGLNLGCSTTELLP